MWWGGLQDLGTIEFYATNNDTTHPIESNRPRINVTWKTDKVFRPDLYMLTLSVDHYRDGDLHLKYSNHDAQALTQTFTQQSKDLFDHIHTYALKDDQVTKANIEATLKKIGTHAKRQDVFILYVAGHGITDPQSGAYFYLPVDFRYKDTHSILTQGFSQDDFKKALTHIQALKSLILLDTCNSGSFAESIASSRGLLQKTAVAKLTRATGRATIVASSKDQVALEGYKGHGVFTYALIDALKGKGYGTDNKITIKELSAYVEDAVPDITYKKWHYEQVPQAVMSGRDFPVGLKQE